MGGGLCGGGSGAPQFFDPNGDGHQVQIALDVRGDTACRASDFEQRLDLPDVPAWTAEQLKI